MSAATTTGIDGGAFRLDGQVALITGASRNIGAAIAGSFANLGADVLITARGGGELDATAAAIRAAAPDRRIETFAGDVGKTGDVEQLAAEVLERFGRVDILVNNAYSTGLQDGVNVLGVTDAVWQGVLESNLLGPVRLTRALAPAMLAGDGGTIINLISGSGFLPNSAPGHLPTPTMAPYGVSKAALWMLTRYLAAELAPRIRVNALCPGLTSEGGGMQIGRAHV